MWYDGFIFAGFAFAHLIWAATTYEICFEDNSAAGNVVMIAVWLIFAAVAFEGWKWMGWLS